MFFFNTGYRHTQPKLKYPKQILYGPSGGEGSLFVSLPLLLALSMMMMMMMMMMKVLNMKVDDIGTAHLTMVTMLMRGGGPGNNCHIATPDMASIQEGSLGTACAVLCCTPYFPYGYCTVTADAT